MALAPQPSLFCGRRLILSSVTDIMVSSNYNTGFGYSNTLPLLWSPNRARFILPLEDQLGSVHDGLPKLLHDQLSFLVKTQKRLSFGFAFSRNFVVALGTLLLQQSTIERLPARMLTFCQQ